nr:hypothetical protein [Tanacetum cinerariifolium]
MQQFDAMLPIELTNVKIRNSDAYKEYYVVATGDTPKTKASVRKTRSSSNTTVTPCPTAAAGPRLSTSAKCKQPAKTSKAKSLTSLSEEDERNDEDDQEEGSDDEQASDEEEFIHPSLSTHDEEETRDKEKEGQDEEDEEDELYRDVNINLGRSVQMADVHMTQEFEDSHVTLTPVNPDGQQQSSSVSSQFVTSMLNLTPDAGIEFIFETTSQMDSDRLRDEAQAENDEFLKTIDENMQKIIKEQVKEQVKVQVSKIIPKIEQTVNEQLEAEVLTQSSNSSKTSYAVAADISEMELKKILIEKMKGYKSIHRSNEQRNLYKALVEAYESDKIILYGDTGSKRRREGKDPESASAPRSAGKSTQGSKSQQTSASESATVEEPMQTTYEMEEPSHPEFETDSDWNKTLLATHGSIQPWISNLAKQTDSHSSFNELMDTLADFSAFLMNRLKVDSLTPELLAGPTYELIKGSCKSMVELKFFLEEVYKATIDQLDWVNPEGYDKHALWEISHWGRKHQQFYDFTINQESARDVYLKRRIIVVTELKIVEWHNYKYMDWIAVRRDDDNLYKFKEGDFKRLRIEDIEDMLLLLVQGKLTNLMVEERFAFNVSLRMFTRSIVIQRRVEDIQVGVESYEKKLNLTWLDTYRSDLKRKEAYIAYSNPRGFIYQNKDKENRLIWIDVCTALDDRLKGIQMKYLPQTIWRKSDKDRAAAMIQAIDKQPKTRRIMRSLERFVGGKLYEGDFRMLQRTI